MQRQGLRVMFRQGLAAALVGSSPVACESGMSLPTAFTSDRPGAPRSLDGPRPKAFETTFTEPEFQP